MEEEKIKKIIAVFIQKQPGEISGSTIIDKSVVSGSILIHRMYRELSHAGFPVENYTDINTYQDLLNRLNGLPVNSAPVPQTAGGVLTSDNSNAGIEIGIDIENISNFPMVNDFREDAFYKSNFSNNEISYCILKPSPIESFAGLFSLKEAICKTDERYRKIPLSQLEITHTAKGKPQFAGYALSVSHTKDIAAGVAIKITR